MAALPGAAHAFDVQVFAPTNHSADTAAMDATLGIRGLAIEDFEDVDLAPGLQVSTSAPDSGPRAVLPRRYLDGSGFFSENAWAGAGALVNTVDNVIWCSPALCDLSNIAARVTFTVPGVRRFGTGLGNFQGDVRDHALLVNGVEIVGRLESLPGFVSGINGRNGYLLISAGPGESIESVSVEVRTNGGSQPVCCGDGDGLIFDHVAFGDPPELSELTLSRSVVAGCKSVTGRVRLSAPAPPGGRTVRVADTLASATTPATVNVPAGATTASFTIMTVPVETPSDGKVSATLDSTTLDASLVVRPIGMLSLALAPTSVIGGKAAIGKARLECAAAPGPISVDLSSSNAAVAGPVAANIVVPQGTNNATFDVTSHPVLAGTRATLAASANGIAKSKVLSVTPAAVLGPGRLAFGSVPVGSTSESRVVTLENRGAAPFAFTGISLSGAGATWFALVHDCPASLAPGGTCTIGVTFTPLAAGSKSASLLVATGATSTALKVSLSGTGT